MQSDAVSASMKLCEVRQNNLIFVLFCGATYEMFALDVEVGVISTQLVRRRGLRVGPLWRIRFSSVRSLSCLREFRLVLR